MRRKRSVITTRDRGARRPGTGRQPPVHPAIGPGQGAARRDRSAVQPSRAVDAGGAAALKASLRPSAVDLGTDLAPRSPGALVLRNPLLVGAGGAGYGIEMADALDIERLGALVTRGTTLHARAGHRAPRMTEVPGGLLNAIGLPNPGIGTVLERYAPRWAAWQAPVIVNLCADTADGFAALADRLDGEVGVAGVELNLSCPDAAHGGTPFAIHADATGDAVSAVRARTELPIIAKLTAAAPDIRAVAGAAEKAGADALSAVNTLAGLVPDRGRGGPLLGATYGGLSGPVLKAVALRAVYEVAQVVRIPVIGVGGVTVLDDVLDLLAVGASAVQVVTAALADPETPLRLADELTAWCAEHGLASHRPLVGTALPARLDRPSSRGAEYRLRG
jgi:dihydroorotate dehydrogenase (NAD+) catalytic subunit